MIVKYSKTETIKTLEGFKKNAIEERDILIRLGKDSKEAKEIDKYITILGSLAILIPNVPDFGYYKIDIRWSSMTKTIITHMGFASWTDPLDIERFQILLEHLASHKTQKT